MKIKEITAREILDSQGVPTIEARVILENGLSAKASVANGFLVSDEAKHFIDGESSRYGGRGVLRAIAKIQEKIAPQLIEQEIMEQEKIDEILLAFYNSKEKIGVNAIFPLSVACARVAALAKGQELFTYLSLAKKNIIPKPIFTMFNGGRYADTNLDFQELMLVPVAEKKCSENVAMGAAIFEQLGEILKQAGYDTDTGTIGAYAPDIDSTIQALELILASAIRSGYNPGEEIALGIDVGSSLLFDPITKRYIFSLDQAYFSAQTLSSLYREWLSKFPLVLLEDPFVATEKDSWRSLTAELGKEMLIAGDDLFAGDIKKFKAAKEENLVNTLVLKPDQCLTVTGALSLAALAKKQGYKIIVSERNGETNDDFIADFAVAISADYLKAGALRRGERLAKYNRLMEIENQLYGKK